MNFDTKDFKQLKGFVDEGEDRPGVAPREGGYMPDSLIMARKKNPGLYMYIHKDNWALNKKLRARKWKDLTYGEAAMLNNIIKIAKNHEELADKRVFRGEGRSKKTSFYPGDNISYIAPTSASLSPETAIVTGKDEGRKKKVIVFEYHGTDRAKSVITNTNEQEVIFAPGTKGKVRQVFRDVWFTFSTGHKGKTDEYVVVEVLDGK